MIGELRPLASRSHSVEAPQSIEAVGTTVEEAIARALEALNVQRYEVDVHVISTESDRRARVRVTVKPREGQPAGIAADETAAVAAPP